MKEIFNSVVGIITTLKDETNFFQENPFVDPDAFCKGLIVAMQEKQAATGDHMLTEEEFTDLVNRISEEGVNETLMGLSEKGLVETSVNSNGELVFRKSPGVDLDSL